LNSFPKEKPTGMENMNMIELNKRFREGSLFLSLPCENQQKINTFLEEIQMLEWYKPSGRFEEILEWIRELGVRAQSNSSRLFPLVSHVLTAPLSSLINAMMPSEELEDFVLSVLRNNELKSDIDQLHTRLLKAVESELSKENRLITSTQIDYTLDRLCFLNESLSAREKNALIEVKRKSFELCSLNPITDKYDMLMGNIDEFQFSEELEVIGDMLDEIVSKKHFVGEFGRTDESIELSVNTGVWVVSALVWEIFCGSAKEPNPFEPFFRISLLGAELIPLPTGRSLLYIASENGEKFQLLEHQFFIGESEK
jgi:hypothetical protein